MVQNGCQKLKEHYDFKKYATEGAGHPCFHMLPCKEQNSKCFMLLHSVVCLGFMSSYPLFVILETRKSLWQVFLSHQLVRQFNTGIFCFGNGPSGECILSPATDLFFVFAVHVIMLLLKPIQCSLDFIDGQT